MNELLGRTATFLDPNYMPEHELLESPVATESGDVPVVELWRRFYESEYGEHMDTQPLRFAENYGYDRAGMIRDLGADVVPQLHQYETALYGAWLLEAERQAQTLYDLSDHDVGVTLFAMAIHDMGETTHPEIEREVGATVGDIPYGRKTSADRQVEAAVRSCLYERLFADVPTPIIQKVEAIISHDDETLAHEFFEASHNLQSYVTAVRARLEFEAGLSKLFEGVTERDGQLEVVEQQIALRSLQQLYTGVTFAMRPHVLRYAAQYEFGKKVYKVTQCAVQAAVQSSNDAYMRFRTADALIS